MRVLTHLAVVLLCLFSLSGCSKKETPPPVKAARISATKAYEVYFGPAPTTSKGTCYAFVIYFPSAVKPGKVVPFPFFTFDEASIKKVALQRLVAGMDEKSYAREFLQLFPTGTRLLSLTQQGGLVVANFSKEVQAAVAESADALYNSVSLTLAQFPGVTSTKVQSEGFDLHPTGQEPPSEASAVLPPSAPRLLKVTGAQEKGSGQVTEVDALFDRPVDIRKCQFAYEDGSQVEGERYHSMFDMAAVLKPKDPARLKSGTRIRVSWDVTDKKGRVAVGDDLLPLEVTTAQE